MTTISRQPYCLQHLDEPRIHATDLEDGHEPAFRLGLLRKIGKKLPDFLPLGADLPLEDGLSLLIADIYRKLVLVLVDTEI